jgi:GT2 family glycosyltransferase
VTPPDPLVDVVVVTWNTRDITLGALRHLEGVAPAGTRLVIRDNGSTDGTAAAIAEQFPHADFDAGVENLGFAGGVNAALRRTKAPWVLLLNSDAWPEPGAIEELIACAERHPAAGAVAPKLLRPDGGLEHSTWPFPTLRTATSSALRPRRYVWAHDVERKVDWAVGAALLLRRSTLDTVGGLDDSLFMYAEDLDWCWRANQAGWEVWFTPAAVVRHIGNASGEQRFGGARAAAWINNSVRVYRRRHHSLASLAWQSANAAGAALAARRARQAGDDAMATAWSGQRRAWLSRPQDDRPGTSP